MSPVPSWQQHGQVLHTEDQVEWNHDRSTQCVHLHQNASSPENHPLPQPVQSTISLHKKKAFRSLKDKHTSSSYLKTSDASPLLITLVNLFWMNTVFPVSITLEWLNQKAEMGGTCSMCEEAKCTHNLVGKHKKSYL